MLPRNTLNTDQHVDDTWYFDSVRGQHTRAGIFEEIVLTDTPDTNRFTYNNGWYDLNLTFSHAAFVFVANRNTTYQLKVNYNNSSDVIQTETLNLFPDGHADAYIFQRIISSSINYRSWRLMSRIQFVL